MPFTPKQIILTILTVSSGFLFWNAYTLTAGTFTVKTLLVSWSLVTLLIYLSCVSLFLLLEHKRIIFVIAIALSLLAPFIFFRFSVFSVVFSLLTVIAASVSFTRTKHEIANRITSGIYMPLRNGLPIFVTALVILMTSLYYTNAVKAYELKGDALIPRSFYDWILRTDYGPVFIQRTLPGFEPQLTVNEYIVRVFESQTGQSFSRLSQSEKEAIFQETRKQIRNEFNIDVRGNEKLSDVFYTAMVTKSETLIEPYRRFIPIAFAVALFLFLRTTAAPFSLLVIFVVWGIVKLLIQQGSIQITQMPRTHEEIAWK